MGLGSGLPPLPMMLQVCPFTTRLGKAIGPCCALPRLPADPHPLHGCLSAGDQPLLQVCCWGMQGR